MAILHVLTRDTRKKLYHSRKGLTENKEQATVFKSLKHAERCAVKRYSPRLIWEHAAPNEWLYRDLIKWTVTITECETI